METPMVDVIFAITGGSIPVDHGFALYSAISRIYPKIHEETNIGVQLIRGRYSGDGMLDITSRSELVLRLPVDRIAPYLILAGKRLDIGAQSILPGTMISRALIPSVALYAHIVTTKNGHEPDRFQAEIIRQLADINIHQAKVDIGKRRTFGVHGRQVVGYSVLVSQLTAEESIALQETGLGGRRKMGCGFFEPWRE